MILQDWNHLFLRRPLPLRTCSCHVPATINLPPAFGHLHPQPQLRTLASQAPKSGGGLFSDLAAKFREGLKEHVEPAAEVRYGPPICCLLAVRQTACLLAVRKTAEKGRYGATTCRGCSSWAYPGLFSDLLWAVGA